eukprot:2921987-Pleurochrysis_carterae.AAC.1
MRMVVIKKGRLQDGSLYLVTPLLPYPPPFSNISAYIIKYPYSTDGHTSYEYTLAESANP